MSINAKSWLFGILSGVATAFVVFVVMGIASVAFAAVMEEERIMEPAIALIIGGVLALLVTPLAGILALAIVKRLVMRRGSAIAAT